MQQVNQQHWCSSVNMHGHITYLRPKNLCCLAPWVNTIRADRWRNGMCFEKCHFLYTVQSAVQTTEICSKVKCQCQWHSTWYQVTCWFPWQFHSQVFKVLACSVHLKWIVKHLWQFGTMLLFAMSLRASPSKNKQLQLLVSYITTV